MRKPLCGRTLHRRTECARGDQVPQLLWLGHQTRVLHSVIVGSDSVSGVPFHLPPECDSCRAAVARSMMDSMRLGNQERGALRSLGLGYVALGVAALVLYLSVDTD
jgi:hypothetical protein